MKKTSSILTTGVVLSAITLTSACSSTGTFEAEAKCNSSGCEATGKVVGGWGSLLKPVATMIATATGFSMNDWLGLDPSAFYIQINENTSITNLKNQQITVKVYSQNSLLQQKTFATKKVGNSIYFNAPSEVKTWSQSFVDVADEVKFTFDNNSYVAQPSSINFQFKEGNNLLAQDTVHIDICGGGLAPTVPCDNNW